MRLQHECHKCPQLRDEPRVPAGCNSVRGCAGAIRMKSSWAGATFAPARLGDRVLGALLQTIGLAFPDAGEERAFRRAFAGRHLPLARIFLVLAGLIVLSFILWDFMIDPATAPVTAWVRAAVLAPSCVIAAIVLHWEWARSRFDQVIFVPAVANTIGGSTICALLAGGFDVVASGLMLVVMFVFSVFRIRTTTYLLFAAVTAAGYLVALQFARDYAPFMSSMNVLLIGTALFIGIVAVVSRELGARAEFRAEQEIARSHLRIEELLHSILPAEIVRRMQSGEQHIADLHGEVSIVFADLVGFTRLSQQLGPQRLVAMLSRLFAAFDEAAERHGVHKIKTIGDAYMAVGGLGFGGDTRDPAHQAAGFAIAAVRGVRKLAVELGLPLDVRVGIHAGPVVAGVIGARRPAFDCWGEAVNLASRLESAAAPGSILFSEQAWLLLREAHPGMAEQTVELKGIGLARAYALAVDEEPSAAPESRVVNPA